MRDTDKDLPLTHTVKRVMEMTGLGRTKIYELVKAEELELVKFGARSAITHASLVAMIERRRSQAEQPKRRGRRKSDAS